uniref:Uncharacterized protein n=1 Tax=Opuntia streptacantha TaxID=393608 RepID=A0A7C9ETJ3_OPUST
MLVITLLDGRFCTFLSFVCLIVLFVIFQVGAFGKTRENSRRDQSRREVWNYFERAKVGSLDDQMGILMNSKYVIQKLLSKVQGNFGTSLGSTCLYLLRN